MEAIQEAIRRLENIPATVRKRKDVEDAITQLSATARLLELPSASTSTFARLAENLRGRLLPLYRVSLPLTLDYVIAVIRFIHDSKLVYTMHNLSSPNPWETLLISLLSGVLDILDENSSNKIRENIAYALYPILCPLYFVPPTGSPLKFHGELLSTVYQTLTATVTSHPRNSATLREHHIDRQSFGVTISQTKDFLALESLLDLFGSLIPSSKAGTVKRTAFIKQVFDTSVFKSFGNQIHKLLEDISNPDWSVTSEKIISILAGQDISFPQPFEATGLLLNESVIASFSPFYVDKKQFVINIDKDGSIETLSIPYSITKNILASTSAEDTVQIIVQLTKSPMLGNQPVLSSSNEESLTISWNVKRPSLTSFGKALRNRDLNVGKLGSYKLSKVKPIELGFHPNIEDSQVVTKKRLEQLSQSWALPSSPKTGCGTDVLPETSPLFTDSHGQMPKALNADENTVIGATQPPFTVFINTDTGALSHLPEPKLKLPEAHKVDNVCPTTPRPHLGNTIQQMSDDEDSQFLVRKFKKRHFIMSDDEESIVDDFKAEQLVASKLINKITPEQPSLSPVTAPIRPMFIKEEVPVKTGKYQDLINVDADEKSMRPPKRGHQEASSPLSAHPYKRAKYSRKGRTSSPIEPDPLRIDFEEIPQPQNQTTIGSSIKSKASGMKGKKGKPQIKPKPVTMKKQVKQILLDKKLATMRHPAKEELFDVPIISSPIEEEVNDHDEALTRRSLRASTVRSRSNGRHANGAENSRITKKPSKAPWEAVDFLEKAKVSDPVIPTSDSTHFSSVAQVEEQNLDASLSKDIAQFSKPAPIDHQGFYPMEKVPDDLEAIENHQESKGSTISNDRAEEAVIIDLTVDTPLVPTLRLKRVQKTSLPPDVCICKSHHVLSDPLNEEILTSKEPKEYENLTEASRSKKVKAPGQTFSKKSKIDEIVKTEDAQQPSRLPILDSKSRIQKIIPDSLAMEDVKDCLAVNFTLPQFESPLMSNKIHIPPIKISEPIDQERQKPESKRYSKSRHAQNSHMKTQILHDKIVSDPMQRLLEIVQQINEVVVHNVENRFEQVTESLSAGQRAILEATANSLQEMYHESAQHFNDMVDLEEEYASHCDTITCGAHDYIKSSEQLTQSFKDVSLDHSRRSLSKKFPPILFPKIPAIILNPAVKL